VTTLVEAETEADFEQHLKALGLMSLSAYKLWCVRSGFDKAHHKTEEQRQAEVQYHLESLVEERGPDISIHHNPRRTDYIARIFRGECQNQTLSDILHRIRRMYNNLAEVPEAQQALGHLLAHVEKYGDFLRPGKGHSRFGNVLTNNYLAALEQLARHHSDWIRPVEDWRTEEVRAEEQFRSLALHLLANYDVPGCFYSAFLQGTSDEAQLQQDWFKHIALGQNIRTARHLSMRLTKRMAHMLSQAGEWLTVPQAFRSVQFQAFGGKPKWSLLSGPLGYITEDEPFWETVVQFLANQIFLDASYINPIVDYIRNQKYTPQRILQADGTEVEGPPPHPAFCMKGRSISKLIHEVDHWHTELSGLEDIPLETWEPSGFREFGHDVLDPELKRNIRWTFHELTTSANLQVEGRVMSHCVGSYVKRCLSGQESVWSLRALDLDAEEEKQVQEHVLTVSVENRKKTVTQYAGKYNLKPFGKKIVAKKRKASGVYIHLLTQSPRFLRMWMDREGLSHT